MSVLIQAVPCKRELLVNIHNYVKPRSPTYSLPAQKRLKFLPNPPAQPHADDEAVGYLLQYFDSYQMPSFH